MEKAWVVAVNMGYGHQRAAHPLRDLAYKGQVICANDYDGIPDGILNLHRNSKRLRRRQLASLGRVALDAGR